MDTKPALRKVTAIGAVIALAAIGGVVAGLSGIDWVAAFGPTIGGIASIVTAWVVKEPIAILQRYLQAATQK